MEPHSFVVDPAVIRNADPDPALQNCGVTFKLYKKLPYSMKSTYVVVDSDHYRQSDNWVSAPIFYKYSSVNCCWSLVVLTVDGLK